MKQLSKTTIAVMLLAVGCDRSITKLDAQDKTTQQEHTAITVGFEYGGIATQLHVVNLNTGPVPLPTICEELRQQDCMTKIDVIDGLIRDPAYIDKLPGMPELRKKCEKYTNNCRLEGKR